MPNAVKYKTGNLTGSLQKGNVALGISGSLGPTSTTGWYNGPNPVAGKYQIFETAASGDPDVYCPQDDAELIKFARWKGATGADTGSAAAVLAWIGTQTNLMAANFQYEGIVTDGLVLNLDAGFVGSYPTTNTTWYDLSGNNRNGTLVNGVSFNSSNSGSIVFDGVDDYVSLSSYNLNDSFTYGIWVLRSGSGNQGNRGIVISNAATYIDIGFNDGIMFSLILSNGSQNLITYGTMVPINQWAYYSATYNQQSAILYLNGSQIASNNYSLGVGRITNAFTIGSFDGGSYNLNGKIAIAQVYNRALSATEILQNYNAQKGRFGL